MHENAYHTAKVRRLTHDPGRWAAYLYGQRRSPGATLERAEGAVDRPIYDHLKPSESGTQDGREAATAAHDEAGAQAQAFGREVFSRLYGDAEALEPEAQDPKARWASAAHGILDGLSEWETLCESVRGDPDFAALAAAGLLERVGDQLPELLREVEREDREERQERERQEQGQGQGAPVVGDGQPGNQPGNQPAHLRRPPPRAGVGAKDLLRASLRSALRQAAGDVDERKEAMEGLAPGLAATPPKPEQADPARMQLAERLKKDERLKRTLQLAGRLRRIADQRKRVHSVHAREEVVDIERGADLARVLPSELAALGAEDPDLEVLELLALKRLADRTLLQHRLEGTEPLGRGPVVLLLDESGSMEGESHLWARAVGIASVGIAAREHRPVTVIGFNAAVRSVLHLDAHGRASHLPVLRAAGRDGAPGLGSPRPLGAVADLALAVATQDCSGGTRFDPPLALALDGLPAGVREERADLVFVTDGQAHVSPAILEALAERRQAAGLRVYGLTVGGGSTSEAVRAICDRVVSLDRHDAEEVAGALP